MRKLSIKKLVIIFVAGLVLVTGAQVALMATSDSGRGFDRSSREEICLDGDCSEEDMQEYLKIHESKDGRESSGRFDRR